MKKRWLPSLCLLLSSAVSAQNAQTPKEECEALMNASIPFAEQMLKKNGEFFPYGSALKTTGNIASVAGYDGRERPPSAEVIKLLKQGFSAGANSGEYKATALVYDVRVVVPSVGKKSDAIAVSLNHKSNYSVVVFFPYQLKAGVLTYGEVFSQKGEADIFDPR